MRALRARVQRSGPAIWGVWILGAGCWTLAAFVPDVALPDRLAVAAAGTVAVWLSAPIAPPRSRVAYLRKTARVWQDVFLAARHAFDVARREADRRLARLERVRPPTPFEAAHEHTLQLLREARDTGGTAVSRAERSVQARREYERLARDATAAGEDGYARDLKAAVGNPGYPRAAKLLEQAADRAGRRLSRMRRPAELEQWHVALTLALRAYLVAAAAL